MKPIAFVMGLLLTSLAWAQEPLKQWAGRAEYELATDALGKEDLTARLTGLLAWEAAYPNSEFAPERTQQIIYAFQRASATGQPQISILYKVVALAPTLQKRSAEQVKVIHDAASALLEQLGKPGIVAPADAKELATRALVLEVR